MPSSSPRKLSSFPEQKFTRDSLAFWVACVGSCPSRPTSMSCAALIFGPLHRQQGGSRADGTRCLCKGGLFVAMQFGKSAARYERQLSFAPADRGWPGHRGAGVEARGKARSVPMRSRAGGKEAPTKISITRYDCFAQLQRHARSHAGRARWRPIVVEAGAWRSFTVHSDASSTAASERSLC